MSDGEHEPEDWRGRYGGLIGVLFVLGLVVGAIWMIERMRAWATLGDCAFTRAPACRALIND